MVQILQASASSDHFCKAVGTADVIPSWHKSAAVELQEAASLALKGINVYSFWINVSISHMLDWTVALAGLGTGWLVCGPPKRDRRVGLCGHHVKNEPTL